MSYLRGQPCALCQHRTQQAICGNRLLSHVDVRRLSVQQVPMISWRCERHQGYQMREASAVHANALGDLIYSLACGHEVQSIVRGVWGYTPALIARKPRARSDWTNPSAALSVPIRKERPTYDLLIALGVLNGGGCGEQSPCPWLPGGIMPLSRQRMRINGLPRCEQRAGSERRKKPCLRSVGNHSLMISGNCRAR